MLTRTTGCRVASVLLAALVAVALVTVGGTTRGPADGVNVDSSHAHVVAKHVRATQAVAVDHVDHARAHADLAATAPVADSSSPDAVTHTAIAPADVRLSREPVAPTGRGPPTV